MTASEWIAEWIVNQAKAGATPAELDGRVFVQGRTVYTLKKSPKGGKYDLKMKLHNNLIVVIPEE